MISLFAECQCSSDVERTKSHLLAGGMRQRIPVKQINWFMQTSEVTYRMNLGGGKGIASLYEMYVYGR